ncbi:MAG: STAS domain-containing protein [Deltaproteobacteria bacterium]
MLRRSPGVVLRSFRKPTNGASAARCSGVECSGSQRSSSADFPGAFQRPVVMIRSFPFSNFASLIKSKGLKMPDDCDFDDADIDSVKITRSGFSIRIGFNLPKDAETALSISNYRDEMLRLMEVPECSTVIFDMTGVDAPPSGLVGLLASAKDRGCEVELLNPSPGVQEILRVAKLDSCLLIRGAT